MTGAPAWNDEGPQQLGRFDWERIVLRIPMPGSAKFLALLLATHADKDGSRVFPGVKKAALYMEVSERTVNRGFVWLRDNGFVTRVKQGNRWANKSDEYQLTAPSDVLDRMTIDPDGRQSK